MPTVEPSELGPWLTWLSGTAAVAILGAAVLHLLGFLVLWVWYRRDLKVIAGSLDDFTRGLRHRSVLGRSVPLTNQIDAFVADVNDVLHDASRHEERQECLRRMHILDERRSYLESLAFDTTGNTARTMIEAYPLAGVLGTILALGAALQQPESGTDVSATMSTIVARFGDAIWSTFWGLLAAILLMFVNSLLETRFERLTRSRAHVRDMVAGAKRELGLSVTLPATDSSEPSAAERSTADASGT